MQNITNLTYQDNITTKEDYLERKGIDLDVELASQINDVGDAPSLRCINEVEEWMIDYINNHFTFSGDRSNLSNVQKKWFKRAIIEQIEYILNNGDLSIESGFKVDTGVIISNTVLDKISLAPNAYRALRRTNLANVIWR